MTILNKISKEVTMKQGLDLSIDRQEEEIIWAGVTVNVLMYENLIAESDR